MPVKLERPAQLSPQDIIDLNKIELEVTQQETPDWQQKLDQALEQNELLIGGRFNDRLLVRLWLHPLGNEHYEIKNIAVRKMTRGRGVARQLLQALCKQADQQQWQLSIQANDFSQSPMFSDLGFIPDTATSVLTRKPEH